VHWPSTARTRSPVVRELDPPDATGVAVVVDLGPAGTGGAARWPSSPPGPEEVAVERAVSRAAGLARSVLATGGRVVLCTAAADGAGLAREVSDGAEVGRRLARAVAGPPPAPPPGWTAVRVSAAEGAADAAPGAADGAAGDPADGAAPVGGSR
jgi:uncharacterized protein (DUF58 family)